MSVNDVLMLQSYTGSKNTICGIGGYIVQFAAWPVA